MSETNLRALAEKEATIWEHTMCCALAQVKQPTIPQDITFKDFVEEKWIPNELENNDHRPSTIAFRRYLLCVIIDYLGKNRLKDIGMDTFCTMGITIL